MLSEALCSRARKVSERKVNPNVAVEEDEVPFARRAREEGKDFRGGKNDGQFGFSSFVFFAHSLLPHL